MSARSLGLILAPNARRDFRDILLYTEQQWGRSQRRAYRKQLDTAFAQLTRFPGIGIPRPEFGQGMRGHRVGQHVIVYESTDTNVLVARILHVRRDHYAELN